MRDIRIGLQTESTVRHTKCGRMRRMVVGEGGRSTGVLLYIENVNTLYLGKILNYIGLYLCITKLRYISITFCTTSVSQKTWALCPELLYTCNSHSQQSTGIFT